MNTKKDFLFYTNDSREIPFLSQGFSNPPVAYIICENSFQNNIDMKMFPN